MNRILLAAGIDAGKVQAIEIEAVHKAVQLAFKMGLDIDLIKTAYNQGDSVEHFKK
jgi:hypothetical protein